MLIHRVDDYRWLVALAVAGALSGQAGTPAVQSIEPASRRLVFCEVEAGCSYGVECAASPAGPWNTNVAGLVALPPSHTGTVVVTLPEPAPTSLFWRVRARLPPWEQMVTVPAGGFSMGDGLGDGDSGETPVHSVSLDAYQIGAYEVTKWLWDDVRVWAATRGYAFANAGAAKGMSHPVHSISWYDAVKWCNARSEREGLQPCYFTDVAHTTVYRSGDQDLTGAHVVWSATGYRLPTEAEWERASRAGSSGTRFAHACACHPTAAGMELKHTWANYYSRNPRVEAYDTSATWYYHPTYGVSPLPYTAPVGSLASNAWAIFDLSGNVSEWCWDWYVRERRACDDCYGMGSGPCMFCFGMGYTTCWYCFGADPGCVMCFGTGQVPCWNCNGLGRFFCWTCMGVGYHLLPSIYYASTPAANPRGPEPPFDFSEDAGRAQRGGGYDSYAIDCRSASRLMGHPVMTSDNLGFRVVRRAPQ